MARAWQLCVTFEIFHLTTNTPAASFTTRTFNSILLHVTLLELIETESLGYRSSIVVSITPLTVRTLFVLST